MEPGRQAGQPMTMTTPFKQGADFNHLRRVIRRETTDGPVPVIEMFVDGSIMGKVTGVEHTIDSLTDMMDLTRQSQEGDLEALAKWVPFFELAANFSKTAGYDSAISIPSVPIPHTGTLYAGVEGEARDRAWQNEHGGIITDRASFEKSEWGTVDEIFLGFIDYSASLLPPGMKLQVSIMGIFEDLRALMGFEPMAIKSITEPHLLDDILEKLSVLAEAAIERCAAHPDVGFICYFDDMGFKTSTLMPPDWYREYLMPRCKRFAEACHRHDKPFVFHSCGNIDSLMEDLIEVVGIDGLHSFEDTIEPVESVYRRYGDRISILGGVDVDLLARGSQQEVRDRCREILDACGPGGGFALGSGNSVTNYCNIENYYAMIDEARMWNQERAYL